jgi:hypothetical protein
MINVPNIPSLQTFKLPNQIDYDGHKIVQFISHYSCAYQFVLQPGKCASSIGNVFSDAHDVMRIFRLPKGTMSIFENMLLPSHISSGHAQQQIVRNFLHPASSRKKSQWPIANTQNCSCFTQPERHIIQVHEYYVCLQLGHWPFWHRLNKLYN